MKIEDIKIGSHWVAKKEFYKKDLPTFKHVTVKEIYFTEDMILVTNKGLKTRIDERSFLTHVFFNLYEPEGIIGKLGDIVDKMEKL